MDYIEKKICDYFWGLITKKIKKYRSEITIKNRLENLKNEVFNFILEKKGDEKFYNELDRVIETNNYISELLDRYFEIPKDDFRTDYKLINELVEKIFEQADISAVYLNDIKNLINKIINTINTTLNSPKDENERKIINEVRSSRNQIMDPLEKLNSSIDKMSNKLEKMNGEQTLKESFKSIGEFFEEWNDTVNPKITGDFLILGREDCVENVKKWINNKEHILNISADSKDEAILFFISAVNTLDENVRENILQNSFVIESVDNWNKLMMADSTLIFIPRFKEVDNMNRPKNCRIVIPYNNDDITQQDDVVQLNKQKPRDFVNGLIKLGINSEKAYGLNNDTNRSLLALRRSLATAPWVKKPKWMEQQNLRMLLPVLFVGSFDENEEEDKNIISELAECSYKEYKEKIFEWTKIEDSPIERTGTIYKMINTQDMWDYLWSYITEDDMKKFKKCALKVLQTENPKFKLDEKMWIMANVINLKMPYSHAIINGITKSLIMIALRNERRNNFNILPQNYVDNIFKKVYENCTTWEKWFSIADKFDTFIEASPNESLSILNKQFENDNSSFWEIFKRNGGGMFNPNYYTHILWGLEKLMYDENYAFMACSILEKLSSKGFEYRMVNSPIDSLYNILAPIYPQYALTSDDRIELLEVMIKRSPNTGWSLLLKILPKQNKIYSSIAKTKWRNYEKKDDKLDITSIEYECEKEKISKLLIDNMQININRWIDILSNISNISKVSIDAYCDNAEKSYEHLGSADIKILRDKLREIISRNREFMNNYWALDEFYISRLEALLNIIDSNNIIEKYSYLFKHHVDLLNPAVYSKEKESSWEENDKEIQLERENALLKIYNELNIDGIVQVFENSDDVWKIGGILATKIFNYELKWDIILALVNLRKINILGYYLAHINHKCGLVELREVIKENRYNLSIEQINIILQSSPFNEIHWDYIDELDQNIKKEYWSELRIVTLMDNNSKESERICNNLLIYERPYTVIELLSYDKYFNVEIAIRALELAISLNFKDEKSGKKLSRVTNNIVEIFKRIYNVLNIDDSKILNLEINYFKIIEEQCEPKILIRELKKSPDLFVELLANVYEEREDRIKEVTEKEKYIAQLSYDILNMFKQLPGFNEDNIDKEFFYSWIAEVRKKCKEQKISDVGESHICRLLVHAPVGEDSIWPHEVVRDFIEYNGNEDMIKKIAGYKRTARGVYQSSGGREEKRLSEEYNENAHKMRIKWPRCFRLLKELGRYYECDAKYEEENDI